MSKGISYALIAFGLWGISPIFWKQLKVIPATELIAWRIILTFLSVVIILLAQKKFWQIKPQSKPLKQLALASFLIGINWILFVYAVNSSQVLQGSLGYFMGPLFTFFIGIIWLKESISSIRYLSLVCFLIAVLILTLKAGVPWLSLSLALTFAIYGLIKKQIKLIPQVTLFFETLILLPFCLLYLVSVDSSLSGLSNESWVVFSLIGFFTYLPLHYFAKAAQEIPLSSLGTMQYIAPLGQFLVGRFWYDEQFEPYQIWAYILVWLGIIIFTSAPFLHRVKSHENL